MNPELYTEEFRDFKYLKSDYQTVQFYKKSADQINAVQPWAATNDSAFRWPCRIEFFEQILDLSNDCLYLIDPGRLDLGGTRYDYEDAHLYTLNKPLLYKGSMMYPDKGKRAGIEDVPFMEDQHFTDMVDGYFLCSEEYLFNKTEGNIIPAPLLPIVDKGVVTLSAMFYDKEWAENYQKSLTTFLRKNLDAISAISRMF